jgi:hypothetical protein
MVNNDNYINKTFVKRKFEHLYQQQNEQSTITLSQTKDYKIGICCFSAKHAALRRNSRLVGSESG